MKVSLSLQQQTIIYVITTQTLYVTSAIPMSSSPFGLSIAKKEKPQLKTTRDSSTTVRRPPHTSRVHQRNHSSLFSVTIRLLKLIVKAKNMNFHFHFNKYTDMTITCQKDNAWAATRPPQAQHCPVNIHFYYNIKPVASRRKYQSLLWWQINQ